MNNSNKIVFIGDSITEWGREGDPEDIGTGYVRLIHDYLITSYPEKIFTVLNRGIGGIRITDLADRWQKDVVEEEPAFVSISIGINDVWRQLDHPQKEQVYPEQFEEIYNDILTQIKEKTKAVIILMEPTIIGEDAETEGNQKLVAYSKIVRKLAEKYGAVLVPTRDAFIQYLQSGTGYKLTIDGVHTNSAGNMLMAKTWIQAYENYINRV